MKKWNGFFFWGMFAFLVAIIFVTFYNNPDLDTPPLFDILLFASYVFFMALSIWVNIIFRRKEQEMEKLEETKENAFFRLRNERTALSEFASTEFSPENACREVSKLINLFGNQWWRDYGEKILSKLFFERQKTKTSEDEYLKDFLKELTKEDYQEELVFLYFEIVPVGDLLPVLAESYRERAVNLINGGDAVSLNKLTLLLQKVKPGSPDSILLKVDEIIADLYEIGVRQKILAIIEVEIDKVKTS